MSFFRTKPNMYHPNHVFSNNNFINGYNNPLYSLMNYEFGENVNFPNSWFDDTDNNYRCVIKQHRFIYDSVCSGCIEAKNRNLMSGYTPNIMFGTVETTITNTANTKALSALIASSFTENESKVEEICTEKYESKSGHSGSKFIMEEESDTSSYCLSDSSSSDSSSDSSSESSSESSSDSESVDDSSIKKELMSCLESSEESSGVIPSSLINGEKPLIDFNEEVSTILMVEDKNYPIEAYLQECGEVESVKASDIINDADKIDEIPTTTYEYDGEELIGEADYIESGQPNIDTNIHNNVVENEQIAQINIDIRDIMQSVTELAHESCTNFNLIRKQGETLSEIKCAVTELQESDNVDSDVRAFKTELAAIKLDLIMCRLDVEQLQKEKAENDRIVSEQTREINYLKHQMEILTERILDNQVKMATCLPQLNFIKEQVGKNEFALSTTDNSIAALEERVNQMESTKDLTDSVISVLQKQIVKTRMEVRQVIAADGTKITSATKDD